MKPKNPVFAAVLNVIIPGLGCAYLGKWFYAIVFLIWVPLAYVALFFAVGVMSSFISNVTIKNISSIVIGLLLVSRILYEQISVPYRMAIEFNQRIENIV